MRDRAPTGVCQHLEMITPGFSRICGAAVVTAWALLDLPTAMPAASAEPCPDVNVVFARGTHEPPGVGGVGQAFIDSLSSQMPSRSVTSYAVNYPASDDYIQSAAVGSDDVRARIQDIVANCPNTKLVLGGYSQGAAVTELATSAMPPQVAGRVAAVALFGDPTSAFSSMLAGGTPLPTVGPAYAAKTINLCVPDDPICSAGGDFMAHVSYIQSGMTSQAATFAASKLS